MPAFHKSFNLKKRDFVRAGEASIAVQNLLKSLSMDPGFVRRVAICGYEGEMNVVMHGGDGTLSIEIAEDRVVLVLEDSGPGIPDVEKAMQAGFSTASDEFREMGFGAGMGLPNMKRNSDDLTIDTEVGRGTRVTMRFDLDDST
ncbi:MAG: ATP-binding protein [Desulfatibacillaceae bacterium]